MHVSKGHLWSLTPLWTMTPLGGLPRLGNLARLRNLTRDSCPSAWQLASKTVAVQESGAVAAVVVEGSSCINALVHVSRGQVPGSCNVLGRHSVHVTDAHGRFW